MDDEFAEVPFGVGSSVIFSTDEKKYVGKLMGRDEDFIYLKATHIFRYFEPGLSPSAHSVFKAMVDEMSIWELKWVCVRKKLGGLLMASQGDLKARVYDWLVMDFLDSQESEERLVEIATPVSMGIPLLRVESFQSLNDVLNGQILSELDFPIGGEYNG